MAADNAWKFRGTFQREADEAYYEHGEERGWPGIIPAEVLEAIASRESGGDPTAVNKTPMPNGEHATGLMQIVPGLGIWSTYEQVQQVSLSKTALTDPDMSAEIAAVALSEKATDVQRTGWFGYGDQAGEVAEEFQDGAGPDWGTVAAIAWFGAGYQDGYGHWQPSWNTTDGPSGISGRDYANYIQAYAAGFGADTERAIMAGDWRNPGDDTRESWQPYNSRYGESIFPAPVFDFVEGSYDGVKRKIGEEIGDAVGGIVGEIGGAIEAALPRVGMLAAGVVLIAAGIFTVKAMVISGAVSS